MGIRHSPYLEYWSIIQNVFLFGVLVLTCFLSREQNSRYGVCYECILTAKAFAYLELQQKMHNKIPFERLLYKHTESLLNLDITTFCPPRLFFWKRKSGTFKQQVKTQKTSTQILSSIPPSPHLTTTTKGFHFIFKGRNRTVPNVFIKKTVSHLSAHCKDKILSLSLR